MLEWYFMYKRGGESVDHLLFHCPIAYELWSMVFVCLVFIGLCHIMLVSYWLLGRASLVGIKT